jgi:hypothetical protein
VNGCPELEALVLAQSEHDPDALAHLRNCPDCAAQVEEHRQLEKDLFRLVDPLPPPDLVFQVMARVAAEPAPIRMELRTGASIVALALMAAVLSFVASHGNIGLLGVRAASGVVAWRNLIFGAGEAMAAIWSTAALPFVVAMAGTVMCSVWGVRRLAAHRVVEVEVEVRP